jgi:hypothetical protein
MWDLQYILAMTGGQAEKKGRLFSRSEYSTEGYEETVRGLQEIKGGTLQRTM